jgi:RimJ/RimL family protein N-acetyltransferase
MAKETVKMIKKEIYIRGFREDEWSLLREMRLRALKEHQSVYTRRYEDESLVTDGEWKERTAQKDGKIFGLFEGWKLIGLTGVFKYIRDEDGRSALLGMSYIDSAYRGRGLSRLLYEARLDWARAAGFERAVVAHKEGNEASRRANAALGFKATHTETTTFGDGSVAKQYFYELDLR